MTGEVDAFHLILLEKGAAAISLPLVDNLRVAEKLDSAEAAQPPLVGA
jgi:hypothetical protein